LAAYVALTHVPYNVMKRGTEKQWSVKNKVFWRRSENPGAGEPLTSTRT